MKTTPTREAKQNDWQDRALKAEARCEQLEAALQIVDDSIGLPINKRLFDAIDAALAASTPKSEPT